MQPVPVVTTKLMSHSVPLEKAAGEKQINFRNGEQLNSDFLRINNFRLLVGWLC